ncbi:hypothetical protein ORV05_29045 [Amycolatopsis cynarae]|uniref:ESX-1 secretion-associated protein n=1 Tax=Amycolatopsis cynarae TaxID=2995223 RepID=A0ABY7AYC7_9PSEU|nr:hypothetical protein [Amycolatopsis sp. HUAS 11-8]WAL64941.1 hypothetical protein ORV05_29045 [Amycolatopsis sp. HUAS 11-8]
MSGFEADAGRLAAGAKDFDGHAERAGRIAAELARALADAPAAWGDDAVGRSFAAGHARPANETAEGIRALAGQLSELGTSLAEAARRYSSGEDAARCSIADAAGG